MNHSQKSNFILGIDLGTSGIRACIVERLAQTSSIPLQMREKVHCQVAIEFSSLEPSESLLSLWQTALETLLRQLKAQFNLAKIQHIIADATSSSVMLVDADFKVQSEVLMYNDGRAVEQAKKISQRLEQYGNPNTAAVGVSSSLAKVLFLAETLRTESRTWFEQQKPLWIFHQIDWLNHYFCGNFISAANHGIQEKVVSDENNLLKLGYEPLSARFPDWVLELLRESELNIQLPKVLPAGEFLNFVRKDVQQKFGFSTDCKVHLGTTDSIAGFFASGASQIGDAVSSLGSTFAIKQLMPVPIFANQAGLYSHKVLGMWLLGGASNGGGKVLLDNYSLEEIQILDQACWRIYTTLHTGSCASTKLESDPLWTSEYQKAFSELLPFYALSQTGERFPYCDANFTGRLAAKPSQPLEKFNLQKLAALFSDWHLESDFYANLNRLKNRLQDDYEPFFEHLLFFNSIVQGLVQIEKQALELMTQQANEANAGEQTFDSTKSALFTVGGGLKNQTWQWLRQKHLQNCLKSSFSENAAYGVTRLILN